MCYKDETQKKNAEKLQRKFDKDNVPEFIRRYFIRIDSKLGAINYWIAIKDLLSWLIDKKIINRDCIADILPQDFYEVESEDVKLYLITKQEHGLSKTTLNTRKHIFGSFWEYLVDTNKCPVKKNIIRSVKYKGKSSNNNLIRKLPSEEQLIAMEEKIIKKHDEFVRIRNLCVFKVLKGTGVRECGLAGLDLDDLFIDEDSYTSIGEKLPCVRVVEKGAYGKDEARIVYLTGSAISAIKEWLEYRNNISNVIDENAVFLNRNGKRFNENNIKDMFKTYGNGVTPHMIRHWYATIIANTGNIAFAQQNLGHTSQNTTINSYANGAYGMKDILANM